MNHALLFTIEDELYSALTYVILLTITDELYRALTYMILLTIGDELYFALTYVILSRIEDELHPALTYILVLTIEDELYYALPYVMYCKQLREAETPENRIPAGRPKRGRSADRRMRPGARFRPGVGGVQGFGPKTAKMPIFTVFRRRPSISRAWQKRFAFLRKLNRGGSAAFRPRSAGAVKVSIALTRVENLSRTPSNDNLESLATPRKGLTDSPKLEQNGTGTPEGLPETPPRKGLTDSLIRPRRYLKTDKDDAQGLPATGT